MKIRAEERRALYAKARAYIKAEQAGVFRDEVATAVEEQNDSELYDRFYSSLSFGTAGMRGLIGGGTNRINPLVIQQVTQALADYLCSLRCLNRVVIAFDSRNYSTEFAQAAALVLAANQIEVYLYESLRSVPQLSYAVRYLQASAGLLITASHNPATYNGYKVYWSDGAQVTPPHDLAIAQRFAALEYHEIKSVSLEKAKTSNLLHGVPSGVDGSYYQAVIAQIRRPEVFGTDPIRIAYTPLHGTGAIPVVKLLERVGLGVHLVESQREPDGNFPTVEMPNPEDPAAMSEAISLAKEVGADLVLGTDPDSDRLGVAVVDGAEYRLLNGNQIAVLLADYLLSCWQELKTEHRQPVVVKSLVTTDLVRTMTERLGGECRDVLTGFKYIAEEMELLQDSTEQFFLFGCEESYGYLGFDQIRDKDAISSALIVAEMVSYHRSQGKSLLERLEELYRMYGYHGEEVLSYSYEGSQGQREMERIMADFRAKQVGEQIGVFTISSKVDLLAEDSSVSFPPADVLIFGFESGEKLVVRPSGTEPKIKYYLFLQGEASDQAAFAKLQNERVAHLKAVL